MRIEDIKTGDSLQGIEPTALVTVVAVVPISTDAIQLVYKTPDATLKDRLLGRHDEKNIAPAIRERPWSFKATEMLSSWRSKQSASTSMS